MNNINNRNQTTPTLYLAPSYSYAAANTKQLLKITILSCSVFLISACNTSPHKSQEPIQHKSQSTSQQKNESPVHYSAPNKSMLISKIVKDYPDSFSVLTPKEHISGTALKPVFIANNGLTIDSSYSPLAISIDEKGSFHKLLISGDNSATYSDISCGSHSLRSEKAKKIFLKLLNNLNNPSAISERVRNTLMQFPEKGLTMSACRGNGLDLNQSFIAFNGLKMTGKPVSLIRGDKSLDVEVMIFYLEDFATIFIANSQDID